MEIKKRKQKQIINYLLPKTGKNNRTSKRKFTSVLNAMIRLDL
jgi:hypothetical protein